MPSQTILTFLVFFSSFFSLDVMFPLYVYAVADYAISLWAQDNNLACQIYPRYVMCQSNNLFIFIYYLFSTGSYKMKHKLINNNMPE